MSTFRAQAEFGRGRRRIKGVAANAVKGRLAPGEFERQVVASVIPQPDAAKDHGDYCAVDHGRGGQIEHARKEEAPGLHPQGSIQRAMPRAKKNAPTTTVGALNLIMIAPQA